jgi:uncharacterized protein
MEKTSSSLQIDTFTATDRIQVIDALRGFALFGIIISHAGGSYLAGATPTGMEKFNLFSPLDEAVGNGVFLLTMGKFFTIFSFLFGLSFAIQLQNAIDKQKKNFVGKFIWRLAILFAIGFTHSLFYSGDILRIYAFLGLFLIPCRKVGNRALLIVSILLILNAPIFIQRIASFSAPPPTAEQIEAGKAQGEQFGKVVAEEFRIKQSGTLGELVKMNFEGGLIGTFFFQLFTGRLFVTFGLFLLGLYVGRKRFFDDTISNRLLFKKTLFWAGGIALISTILTLLYAPPFGAPSVSFLDFIGLTAFDVHQASLSLFYVAGITLLYWHYRPKLLQSWVAVGQMGLTTYLIQSVFGVMLFMGIGFGMMGKIGVAVSVGFGILYFVLQTFFAVWWIRKFHYGFFEWIWRSLTEMKVQDLVRR